MIALLVCSPGVAGMSAWHPPMSSRKLMTVFLAEECCIMMLLFLWRYVSKSGGVRELLIISARNRQQLEK